MTVIDYCQSRRERMDTILSQLAYYYAHNNFHPRYILHPNEIAYLDDWR